MNIKGIGRYAKFITAIAGDAIVYLQFYGTTWHLVPAVTMLGAALGVFGVPNAAKLAAPPAPAPGATP